MAQFISLCTQGRGEEIVVNVDEISSCHIEGGFSHTDYILFLKNGTRYNLNAESYNKLMNLIANKALLDILPKHIGDYRIYLYYDGGEYHCGYIGNGDAMFTLEETKADNPIDACYEMIIKLNEQNLI